MYMGLTRWVNPDPERGLGLTPVVELALQLSTQSCLFFGQ